MMSYQHELDCLNDEIAQGRKDMRMMIAELREIQRGIDLAENRIEMVEYLMEQKKLRRVARQS